MSALSDHALALLPLYGPWALGVVTFLACIALPVPASLVMIAAGAMVAAGDSSFATMVAGGLVGALCGDAVSYAMGQRAGGFLARRMPQRAMDRATEMLAQAGFRTVFLTRWLFSPLGPAVSFVSGATGYARARFALACLMGQMIWVAGYVGLGVGFGANIDAAAALGGKVLGGLAGLVLIVFGLRWLWQRQRARAMPEDQRAAQVSAAPQPVPHPISAQSAAPQRDASERNGY